MAAPRIPNMIDCGQCSLHLVSQTNVWFIEELFRYEDINKFPNTDTKITIDKLMRYDI